MNCKGQYILLKHAHKPYTRTKRDQMQVTKIMSLSKTRVVSCSTSWRWMNTVNDSSDSTLITSTDKYPYIFSSCRVDAGAILRQLLKITWHDWAIGRAMKFFLLCFNLPLIPAQIMFTCFFFYMTGKETIRKRKAKRATVREKTRETLFEGWVIDGKEDEMLMTLSHITRRRAFRSLSTHHVVLVGIVCFWISVGD